VFRIAIRSLLHERAKFVSAVAGVCVAITLFLVQAGTYFGFVDSAGTVIEHMGGDVWIMSRGTTVLDYAELLGADVPLRAKELPCVRAARGLVLSWFYPRRADGGMICAQIIGMQPGEGKVEPWSLVQGTPDDLHAPDRIAVDDRDLGKFGITGVGSDLELAPVFGVAAQTAHVAALTRGVRSFTLNPYVFADIETTRELLGMSQSTAHFWVLDLNDLSCAPHVIDYVERDSDLRAMTTRAFREQHVDAWVGGAGIGAALSLTALLGLVVGAVIVAQTLSSIARDHQRELGTLKAIGATPFELAGFILWQVAVISAIGGVTGTVLAIAVAHAVEASLKVKIDSSLLIAAAVANVIVCGAASAASIRRVLRLEAAEVFK
jgi:putative ABC transport system permease protein